MATYKLSSEAEDDLYRIRVYGAKKFGIKQADRYFVAFFLQFDLIAKDPFPYQSVDYIRKGYRRAVPGVDSIYYRVVEDNVAIMAIIGPQDVQSKFLKSQ